MRDLVLVALLPFLAYYAFKKPFIGAGLWLWTSAFNISHLVYGFAGSISYNRFFALITMASYLVSKQKIKYSLDKLSWLILIFFFWTTASSFLGGADQDVIWTRWTELMKIMMFYFFAIGILHKKIHIDLLIWVLVLSIGALAAGEGLKFIVSGGGHRIGALRGITGDNNFFAVMILVMLPMTFYLVTQTHHKLLKNGLLWLSFLIVLGLISTFSRSGFVGLIILTLFFIKSSKRKVLWIVVIPAIVYSTMSLLPDEWFGRMNTVENAEDDGSFMHRVMVWKMCTVIALNNPVFGEGFKAVENLLIWQQYIGDFHLLNFIPTPEADYHEPVRAAHSFYFQVLSDHGFVGLFIFLLILATTYLKLGSLHKRAKKAQEQWAIHLTAMLKISVIVYCVSGGTVSVAYFDFLYAIFLMVYVLDNRILVAKNETTARVSYANRL